MTPQRGPYFPSALAAGYHTLNRLIRVFVFLMTAADWWTGTSLCPTAYLLTTGVFQFPMMLRGTRGSGELDCLDPVSPDTGPSEPIKTSVLSCFALQDRFTVRSLKAAGTQVKGTVQPKSERQASPASSSVQVQVQVHPGAAGRIKTALGSDQSGR